MGVKLVGEVLDHYRGGVQGYTDVKKLRLLAFAFRAKDTTRTGWPGRAVMAWRTGKSDSRVSHITTALVTDGVIKRAGGGGKHRGDAKYTLLPLAADSQGAPSGQRRTVGQLGGPCAICGRALMPGERIADLTTTGKPAHVACITRQAQLPCDDGANLTAR